MNSIRRSLVGLSLLGVILLAGIPSPAKAATSNGPYYAEPAWDQKLAPATRFVVLTDWNSSAVLDRETGLVWERTLALETATWPLARFVCTNKNVGFRKGWRLPSLPELASLVLVDPSVPFPDLTLPPGHPFINVQPADYWSATTSAESSAFAWIVSFENGNAGQSDKTFTSFRSWCVRGGMNADAY